MNRGRDMEDRSGIGRYMRVRGREEDKRTKKQGRRRKDRRQGRNREVHGCEGEMKEGVRRERLETGAG